MQCDGIRRRQRPVSFPAWGYDPDCADAGGAKAQRGPNLPRECRDRRFPACSGDGGDDARLARKKLSRHLRGGAPAVFDPHDSNSTGRRRGLAGLRDDRDGAGSNRRCNKFGTVRLAAGNRHEHVAAFDRAAVRRQTANLERGGPGLDLGISGQNVGKLHQGSRSKATMIPHGGVKRPRLTCFPAPRPA